MRRKRSVSTLATATLVAGLVAACSLGLDESLIAAGPDGGGDGGLLPDGAPIDGATDGAIPPTDAGLVSCTRDEDCTGGDGCLKPRCDLVRGTCVFDVCKTPTCNTAVCDVTARTCGAPKTHPYRATSFQLGVGASCPVGRACLAAVHPYIFALTTSGAVAYSVADPGSATPRAVPIVGLGFVPSVAVASGNRVYFAANATGGTPSRLPVAWVDVPSDPFVERLTATTALAVWNRLGGEPIALLPRSKGEALVFVSNAAQQFPASVLAGALTEPLNLAATALPITPGTSPVATSGARLLMSTFAANGTASFGFIDGAGTNAPQNPKNDALLAAAGPVNPPQSYAQTPSGAVFWAVSSLSGPLPGATVRAAKGFFLLADDKAAPDGTAGVDLEVYTPNTVPNGTAIVGPAAMLDEKTAMVVAASAQAPGAQATVQFVQREPLGLVKNGDKPKRDVIALPVAQVVAASASNGVGYVLTADSATASSIYVYDPGCTP